MIPDSFTSSENSLSGDISSADTYTPRNGWRNKSKNELEVPEIFAAIVQKLGFPIEIYQISKTVRRSRLGLIFSLIFSIIIIVVICVITVNDVSILWVLFIFALMQFASVYYLVKLIHYQVVKQIRTALVFEEGLVFEIDKEVISYPWSEIKTLYMTDSPGIVKFREIELSASLPGESCPGYILALNPFQGYNHSQIELERVDGVRVTVTWFIESYPILIQMIQTKLLEIQLMDSQKRLLSEGILDDFAPLCLTPQDLSWGQISLPWQMIGRIEICRKKFNIYHFQSKRIALSIPIDQIANPHLLLTLIAWMVNRSYKRQNDLGVSNAEKRLGHYEPYLGWQSYADLPDWAKSFQETTFASSDPQYIYLPSASKRATVFVFGLILILIGAGLAVAFVILFLGANGNQDPDLIGKTLGASALALMIGISLIVVYIRESKNAVVLYAQGIIMCIKNQKISIAFDQIDGLEISNFINFFPVLSRGQLGEYLYGVSLSLDVVTVPQPTHFLHFAGGHKQIIPITLASADHLLDRIQRKMFDLFWPDMQLRFLAGENIFDFPGFRISRSDGITFRERHLNWSSLGNLTVQGNQFIINSTDKKKKIVVMPVNNLLKLPLLITLLAFGANLAATNQQNLTGAHKELDNAPLNE